MSAEKQAADFISAIMQQRNDAMTQLAGCQSELIAAKREIEKLTEEIEELRAKSPMRSKSKDKHVRNTPKNGESKGLGA